MLNKKTHRSETSQPRFFFFGHRCNFKKNRCFFCHGRRSRKATTSTQYLNAPTKMRTSEVAAVSLVVGWFSTAGAGSWGSRFRAALVFQRVFFSSCVFWFIKQVHCTCSKDVRVVCTRIFFGKISMFVRMKFVFPVKDLSFFPFVSCLLIDS